MFAPQLYRNKHTFFPSEPNNSPQRLQVHARHLSMSRLLSLGFLDPKSSPLNQSRPGNESSKWIPCSLCVRNLRSQFLYRKARQIPPLPARRHVLCPQLYRLFILTPQSLFMFRLHDFLAAVSDSSGIANASYTSAVAVACLGILICQMKYYCLMPILLPAALCQRHFHSSYLPLHPYISKPTPQTLNPNVPASARDCDWNLRSQSSIPFRACT
jgi:hypothetical protein